MSKQVFELHRHATCRSAMLCVAVKEAPMFDHYAWLVGQCLNHVLVR